ncbi:MAG: DUF1439 domain-containing protein [Candidatus Obscuribacterales bacterium]|nr:DUF1439 domain-containing protein [Candidatus Obscuribacterales bacterium]
MPAYGQEKKEQIPPSFVTAGKFSSNIQKYSGLTWLTERSLNFWGWLAAKSYFGGSPHLSFKTYSLTDSLSGKFKSLDIRMKGSRYKKIPLGDLHLKSENPFQLRLLKSKKGPSGLLAPLMVSVSGEIGEKQIAKALQSGSIADSLSFLKIDLPGLGDQHLRVIDPKVELGDGEIHINTWLVTAGADKSTGIPLDVRAKPVLKEERFIMLSGTRVQSREIVQPEQFSLFIEDLLNPLVDFGRMDRATHALRVKNLVVEPGKLRFDAKLLLAPKPIIKENLGETGKNEQRK